MMINKKFSLVIFAISSALLLIASCNKEKSSVFPAPPPPPEPQTYQECPKDGDIYRLPYDTLIFNSKAELYNTDTLELPYQLDIALPMGPCAKTINLYGTPEFSPRAAKIKTEEGTLRDVLWKSRLYIRDLILPEDIERILTFPNDKKVVFQLALLNFNRDTIQTNSIIIAYKEKFPEK